MEKFAFYMCCKCKMVSVKSSSSLPQFYRQIITELSVLRPRCSFCSLISAGITSAPPRTMKSTRTNCSALSTQFPSSLLAMTDSTLHFQLLASQFERVPRAQTRLHRVQVRAPHCNCCSLICSRAAQMPLLLQRRDVFLLRHHALLQRLPPKQVRCSEILHRRDIDSALSVVVLPSEVAMNAFFTVRPLFLFLVAVWSCRARPSRRWCSVRASRAAATACLSASNPTRRK